MATTTATSVLAVIDMYSERGGMTAARAVAAHCEAQGRPAMIVKDFQRERLYVKPLALPEVPAAVQGAVDVSDFAARLIGTPGRVAPIGRVGELGEAGGRVLWLSRLVDGTVAGLLDTGDGEAAFVADELDFAEAAGWAQKARVQLTGRVISVSGLLVLDLRRDSLTTPATQAVSV